MAWRQLFCFACCFILKAAPLQGALWACENNVKPAAMAECYTTTVRALHKQIGVIPDRCPMESSSKHCWARTTAPTASSLQLLAPRTAQEEPADISSCAIRHAGGQAAMSLWAFLVCHRRWDSFHAASRVKLGACCKDWRGWKPAPAMLVTSNAASIIRLGPLAALRACMGISIRFASLEAFYLHQITFLSGAVPRAVPVRAVLPLLAPWWMPPRSETRAASSAKGLRRVVHCHMVLGMQTEREAGEHILTAHVASTTNTSKCFPQTDGTA